jgi:hypothetical protein
MSTGLKHFGLAPLFDPTEGDTVCEPLKGEPGYWAGACSVLYEDDPGRFLLYYRLRQPRPIRGGECRIAVSEHGISFTDIWSATQHDLGTGSMEKACLLRGLDGVYRLYLSLVDPETNRWRTDVLEAARPDEFSPRDRRAVFTPDEVGVEGVKDPVVCVVGGEYHMLLSYAPKPRAVTLREAEAMHATGDVYNTGLTKSATALAVSTDGVRFEWVGDVFSPPDGGWDSYCRRISSVLWTPPVFSCFYDGSASVEENYEERAGLAYSLDLRSFTSVTPHGPIITSPYGRGSVRYIDGVRVEDDFHLYYEFTRPDGSHELRHSRVAV